jgi:hypothetical protein
MNIENTTKEQMGLVLQMTVNDLYDILSACDNEEESQRISGAIYRIEELIYQKSNVNVFANV